MEHVKIYQPYQKCLIHAETEKIPRPWAIVYVGSVIIFWRK